MADFAERKARMYTDSGKMYGQTGRIVEVGEVAARVNDGFTGFEELRTSEAEHIIELKPTYGFSKLRDKVVSTDTTNATVVDGDGEFEVRINGTEATDNVELETIEYGRYLGGSIGIAGVAVRIPALPDDVGKTFRWGYYNDNDGFGYLADSDGIALFLRRGGTDTVVRQEDWDDPMDGTGVSGATLDPERMIVYRFDYRWYGAGPVKYRIAYEDEDKRPRLATVHVVLGSKGAPIVEQPNLPIRVTVDHNNVASGTESRVFVGGRHYSVQGRYNATRRVTSELRAAANVGTTAWFPLIAFRAKNDSKSKAVTMRIEGSDVLTDQNVEIAMFALDDVDGTFGSISDTPDSETALEVSTDSTALTGNVDATIVHRDIAASAGNNKIGSSTLGLVYFDVPHRDTPVIFAARALSTSASVTMMARMLEEW